MDRVVSKATALEFAARLNELLNEWRMKRRLMRHSDPNYEVVRDLCLGPDAVDLAGMPAEFIAEAEAF